MASLGCLDSIRCALHVTFLHISTNLKNIYTGKQTKNRTETGSNLSLGTRLTVLSKRLGRKRRCDATPDRCPEVCRFTILSSQY